MTSCLLHRSDKNKNALVCIQSCFEHAIHRAGLCLLVCATPTVRVAPCAFLSAYLSLTKCCVSRS